MSMIWTPRQNLIVQADATISSVNSDPSAPYSSQLGFRVLTTGRVERLSGNVWTDDFAFVIPAALAGLIWCRVTSVSFDAAHSWSTSPGADGTWFQVSSNRTWQINDTTAGNHSSTCTLQFALADGGTVLASSAVTMTALHTP